MSKIKSMAAAVALLAIGAFAWDQVLSAARAQEKKEVVPAVQKWEYKLIEDSQPSEKYLNQLGDEGWEMVAFNGGAGWRAMWLKRPKK